MDKDILVFGKRIKELRLKNDLSLRGLGELSGVSYSFIASIENGRFSPSRETVIALAKALKGADKNQLLLLAGFAPEEDLLPEMDQDQLLREIQRELESLPDETKKEILSFIRFRKSE